MNSWHRPYPSTSEQDPRHYHPQHHYQQQQQQQQQQQYQYHPNHQHVHQYPPPQQQQQHQQLNSLEGVHSGVPTRTTPTLTPTTLRNIEQTFLELSNVPQPESHTNQAGFVPPLVQPNTSSTYISVDSKCWGGGTLTQVPTTSSTTGGPTMVQVRPHTTLTAASSSLLLGPMRDIEQPPARRPGGRRPIKDERLTYEEEERRCMRRERNKMAAARCRKRRMDQTNTLQDETDDLEDKKSSLQQEIQLLQQQRDELEFLLATHKAVCRRRQMSSGAPVATSTAAPTVAPPQVRHKKDLWMKESMAVKESLSLVVKDDQMVKDFKEDLGVKEEPMDHEDDPVPRKILTLNRPSRPTSLNVPSRPTSLNVPSRPTSLAVAPAAFRPPSVADLGVPIETPSAGIRGLNFESMMEGGTGLTPVTAGTGLTPLHSGLTPLTTPVVSAPPVSSASNNCGSQQRSSSSDLSSPDSVPPKLVSL